MIAARSIFALGVAATAAWFILHTFSQVALGLEAASHGITTHQIERSEK